MLVHHTVQYIKIDSALTDVNSTLKIVVTDEVKDVRPYIVCCILRRLDLTREESFKKFIALQVTDWNYYSAFALFNISYPHENSTSRQRYMTKFVAEEP